MSEESKFKFCVESRRLPDGRGGLFINGELIQTCDTEEESDSLGIAAIRHAVVAGLISQEGQALKDDKPFDLFDMRIR